MYTLNVHIRPDDYDSFDLKGTGLSLLGFEIFWKAVNTCLERIDDGRMKPMCTVMRDRERIRSQFGNTRKHAQQKRNCCNNCNFAVIAKVGYLLHLLN